MSKKNKGPKSSKRKGPKGSFDRHFFSVVVGIALGAGAFYAKKAQDAKTTATA